MLRTTTGHEVRNYDYTKWPAMKSHERSECVLRDALDPPSSCGTTDGQAGIEPVFPASTFAMTNNGVPGGI